jgi:hypothetical protein
MTSEIIPEIGYTGAFDKPFGSTILRALFDALSLNHNLPNELLAMTGMSGFRFRIFLNRLINNLQNPRYLEIGSWLGSTACSAMWGNHARVTCIDNWSQFGGPRDVFLSNAAVTKGSCEFSFIESDFRHVDYNQIGKFNVLFFDGPHEEQDQYDGIVLSQSALESEFILVVDDWNWPSVRNGSLRAIRDLNLLVECSFTIKTSKDNNQPASSMQGSDWHNGYMIAVVHKP